MKPSLIKYCRNLLNLTQAELAEKVNVHQTYLGKAEIGQAVLSPELQLKLKAVFASHGLGEKELDLLQSIFDSRKLSRNR